MMPSRKEIIGDATLYLGDCLEIIDNLSGIRQTFTSPPYNQKLNTFTGSGMHKSNTFIKNAATAYFDSLPEEDYQQNQIEIINKIYESSLENASIFYNHKLRWRDKVPIFPQSWLLESKWNMRQEIIWNRGGSITLNAKMFPPCEERIYWMQKGDILWNNHNSKWLSVWNIPPCRSDLHPVSFPLEIPKRSILNCSNISDIILDPFMGSGTTGVAAVQLDRKFIGIEIDEKYFDIACERIAIAQQQQRMF